MVFDHGGFTVSIGCRPSTPGHRALFLPGLTLLVATVAVPVPLPAADTVETWGHRAKDVDFYVGYEGRGHTTGPRRLASELMVGYGIKDRLSGYFGSTVEGEGTLTAPSAGLFAGLFGTPIDTRHFDLDLFLSARLAGARLREYEVTPAFEINLDRTPERDSFGVYLRVALPVARSLDGVGGNSRRQTEYLVEVNPGVYLTLAGRHQVLLEWDVTLHPGRAEQRPTERGVALGYNVALSAAIELINELHLSLPGRGASPTLAFTMGFIATLP